MEQKKQVTKDMSFGEVLSICPEAAEVFAKHGMHCPTCPMAQSETLEQGMQAHGLDVDEIVKEVNDIIKTKNNKR